MDRSRLSTFEITAHHALRDIVDDLHGQGMNVWCILPAGAAELAVARFAQIFGARDVTFFPTIGAAVTHFDDRP